MTVAIPLTRGQVALVDEADVEIVNMYAWYAKPWESGFYAAATVGSGRSKRHLRMHRLILPGSAQIDHKNRNGLDNRRENLRPATGTQNSANQSKRLGGTSRFKGVSWDTHNRCWRASIACNRHGINLGRFQSELEAAMAYNTAALRLFGEYARGNEVPNE